MNTGTHWAHLAGSRGTLVPLCYSNVCVDDDGKVVVARVNAARYLRALRLRENTALRRPPLLLRPRSAQTATDCILYDIRYTTRMLSL